MHRRARLILAFGVLILTVVSGGYLVALSSYSEEYLDGSVLSVLMEAFDTVEHFINRHEKFFIVLSTLAIAGFTGTLWRATTGLLAAAESQKNDMRESLMIAAKSAETARQTVETMKDTAERQLRAYVSITSNGVDVSTRQVGLYGIKINIRNRGNTPAMNVRMPSVGCAILPFPLEQNYSFPVLN